VPLLLLAWPDAAQQKNLFEIGIPHGASLIVQHSWDGVVPGLRSFPKKDQPPVWPTFYGFRIMVALGFWFLFLGWVGAWLLRGGRLHRQSLMLWAFMLSAPLGWIATVLGWIVAEVGRQPWVVYGMLRTAQAVSPVPAGAVAWSFATFVVIYSGLLLTFFYFLAKIIGHGFDEAPAKHPEAMRGARIGEIVEED
jgi:Cytochrome bd-type quinol oxidase, subunit 1